MALGLFKAACLAHVLKLAIAEIVIQKVRRTGQPSGAAHDGSALPRAAGGGAGSGRSRQIEADVIGHRQVQLAIAVVIHKGASRSPQRAGTRNARRSAYFLKSAIALVVVKPVLTIGG